MNYSRRKDNWQLQASQSPDLNLSPFDRSGAGEDEGRSESIPIAGNNLAADGKGAEKALLAANRCLFDIIDFLPDATFAIDKERRVVAWNRAIEKMTGVAASDMLGRGNYEYSLPFYGERRPIFIDLLFESGDGNLSGKYTNIDKLGDAIIGETCIPSLRGKEVYLFGKVSALRDVEGNVVGAIESIRDVTDRKVAEEALRQSEAKYRAIFENATEGIFQIAADGIFLNLNQAFARIFGYASPEELIHGVRHINHQMYVHPEDREKIKDILAETGQIQNNDCEFIDKQGRKKWVSINAHTVRDATGCFLYYEGTVTDISERKLMEQKLLETKDKLYEAQRIGHIGSWSYDLVSGAMWCSDEMCRIVGCDPSQSPFDLDISLQRVHREDREGVAKALEAAVAEMKPYDLSHRMVLPDGSERIIHSRGRVFCDSQGHPTRIAGITRDITKEKILERQVMHREKLASLGMLVSGIAHEINNPNNFITFNIPILRDYVGELMRITDIYAANHPDYELFGMTYSEFREDIFNLLDNIEHGTDRIDGIVRKLQGFSRKKNGEERRLADVEEIVSKAVALCRSQIGRTVNAFEVEITPGLPSMQTDADALEQVLINILINAGQAADKEESRIVLRVAGGASWKNRIIIEIDDNGAGMDQATKDGIFKPFFTTKPRGKGTGLGLYIANNLIESLGGAIEVESEPGRGSLFRIIIPEVLTE